MLALIGKRLLSGLWVVLGITILLFFIFGLLGDPSEAIKAQSSDVKTDEALKKVYYLDKPIIYQFGHYLNDLSPIGIIFHDSPNRELYKEIAGIGIGRNRLVIKVPFLGKSFQTRDLVLTMIFQKLPGTIILAVAAILFASIVGLFLGIFSSLKINGIADRSITLLTLLGISAPSFVVGIILVRVFAIDFGEQTGLEVSGYIRENLIFSDGYTYHWKNLFLPALALGIRPLSIITQLTRSSMLEVRGMDYIRTAHAKGLSPTIVIWKHALRNALNPVLTAVSGWFASLLAGSFFIEYIFDWQGIGKLMIDALGKKDFPVIIGCALTIGVIFVVINILVDILYLYLNPEIRMDS